MREHGIERAVLRRPPRPDGGGTDEIMKRSSARRWGCKTEAGATSGLGTLAEDQSTLTEAEVPSVPLPVMTASPSYVKLNGQPFSAEVVESEAERARLWELADRILRPLPTTAEAQL
jgi:hypothetical protein